MAKGKVNLKTEEEIDLIRQSCQLACEAIAESIKILKPGTSGKDLDLVAQDYIVSKGGYPSFKGYGSPPFPTSLCISVYYGFYGFGGKFFPVFRVRQARARCGVFPILHPY